MFMLSVPQLKCRTLRQMSLNGHNLIAIYTSDVMNSRSGSRLE